MNRSTIAILAACLPVGGLLALVANGNRAAEAITVVAAGTAVASVGWHGPRMAIELHQDTVMRARHRRASTMATRARTEAAEEYDRQEQPDVEPLPDDSDRTLPPSARYPDPYLYRPDDEATHVVDLPAARDELAERGSWYTSTGTAQSYPAPPSAAGTDDLYARGPWAPAAS